MKKVGKYVAISFLLLMGLGCVGILYLFFVPGASLFKLTYINTNLSKTSETYSAKSVSKIEINSRAYEVRVLSTVKENIVLRAHSNSFGFVLTKNRAFEINSELDNGILTYDIIEPHGFATTGDSYIELCIPESAKLSLEINNFKADTIINAPKVNIENLKYSTTKGRLNVESCNINGEINLNLNKGDCTIFKSVITNKNNVDLKLTSGSFKAYDNTLGEVEILQNERGVVEIGTCEKIIENKSSAGGRIYAKTLKNIHVTAADTIISVEKIERDAIITLTASGSVYIGEIDGASSIKTHDGNIQIDGSKSSLSLVSDSGDIIVNNATVSVSVTANYGDVTINFAEDAKSYLTDSVSRTLFASIKNGKLTATGVEHIGKVVDSDITSTGGIKISGNGRVYLNMKNVYGTNSITGNNGSVNIVIDKNSSYTLTTSSAGGDVRVNLTQIPEYNGYRNKDSRTTNVNCAASSNTLTATINYGDLTILDTNFA